MLVRILMVYFSFCLGTIFFSNWRVFPSVTFSVLTENWGKFFFYSIWIGAPYLFLSQIASVILERVFRFRLSYLADLIFIALFLIGPVSLLYSLVQSTTGSSFSFGVSEGEIIRDGVVTELGKHFYFMQKMMEVLHMTFYVLLRALTGLLWPRNVLQSPANS